MGDDTEGAFKQIPLVNTDMVHMEAGMHPELGVEAPSGMMIGADGNLLPLPKQKKQRRSKKSQQV